VGVRSDSTIRRPRRFGVRQLAAAFPGRELARALSVRPRFRPARWPEEKRQQAAALQSRASARQEDLTHAVRAITQTPCGRGLFIHLERAFR